MGWRGWLPSSLIRGSVSGRVGDEGSGRQLRDKPDRTGSTHTLNHVTPTTRICHPVPLHPHLPLPGEKGGMRQKLWSLVPKAEGGNSRDSLKLRKLHAQQLDNKEVRVMGRGAEGHARC